MTLHSVILSCRTRLTVASMAAMGTLPVFVHAEPPAPSMPVVPEAGPVRLVAKPRALMLPKVPALAEPKADMALASPSDGVGPSPFGSKLPNAQTLSAPVTVNANSSADAMTVTQTGGGRAINGAVNNASNGLSAVKGITNGTGSGVNGVNSGTKGPAGKFEITSASSAQPSVLATTAGSASALQAVVKNSDSLKSEAPAVLGQNNAFLGYGTGVRGEGGYFGVIGESKSNGYGVVGMSETGEAIRGESPGGDAVVGFSTKGDALYGSSQDGAGLSASSTTNVGAFGGSDSSYGVQGTSNSSYGVYASSKSNYALYGYSTSGNGIYAYGGGGYAGVFQGAVYVSGAMTAASYGYTSDRDQKQHFAEIDAADVLARISAMPITAWDYKAKPSERHIGPMAQDFHAAFGLGTDEKHIDVVDGIGVSLAAIQELERQGKQKDARIDALERQLSATQQALAVERQAVDARLAALEQAAAPSSATTRP